MLTETPNGLYCAAGDFYIDPLRRVTRAVITHAHADHARRGMGSYLTHTDSEPLLRHRLGKNISVQTLAYGEHLHIGRALVSLHPSGHMLGASQVRVEVDGEVWVVSGDYKREADPLAVDFEVVRCHTFITECTFGLPVYHWRTPSAVAASLTAWWERNAAAGVVSVVRTYSYGKAQRILLNLASHIGPVFASEQVFHANNVIRLHGYDLPPTPLLTRQHVLEHAKDLSGGMQRALVLASGGVDGALAGCTYTVASISGWNCVRRFRQQGFGFTISDHADWPDLLRTVRDTGCERVLAVHGFTKPFTRYLRELGLDAHPLSDNEGEGRGLDAHVDTDSPDWLRQLCIQHVGVAAEADALMRGEEYVPQVRTSVSTTNNSSSVGTNAGNGSTTIVRCVLLHLHRRLGSQTIEKLTMGVWKNEVLVPLAHVGIDVEEHVWTEILQWTVEHTTIQVGPVRTLEPHFVFDVAVQGATPAPRRKIGLRVHAAHIVRYVGTDPLMAGNASDVTAVLLP